MSSFQDLANSIAQMEGFNTPGTIAARNNNPGNLRWAATQIGQENTVNGKYATFATPEEGWAALLDYISKNSGLTLRAFISKYAPPSENDTTNYLNFLSSKLGIGADSPISSLGVSDVGGSQMDTSGGNNLLDNSGDGSQSGGIDPLMVGAIGLMGVGLVIWLGGK
jgi:hypothetical protein